jgi:dUTP pyrophosphatase
MKRVALGILKLDHFDTTLSLPKYHSSEAAGADIAACLGAGNKLVLRPGEKALIPTGLIFEIPQGFEIQVRPRSGISYKTGIYLPNSPGTIDSDYRGELKILVGNLSDKDEVINHGDRLAQLIVAPVIQADFYFVDTISNTPRGEASFGSTGIN